MALLLAAGHELAHEFYTVGLVDMERSLGGAAAAQVGRVDMPAGLDAPAEHYFCLCGLAGLDFGGKLYGVFHLGHGCEYHQEHGAHCYYSLHFL